MANLNLNTIALVSTLRPAPLNGAPSSDDYNDSQNEALLDLASITAFVNNVLIPILAVLPDSALSGLEGSSIYGDTTDQTTLFYDPVANLPLSIADGMRLLNALVSNSVTTVSNLSIQVGQLQQSLSSTNQNNIAISLQNLTNSLNTLTNLQSSMDAAITEIQSTVGKTQTVRLVHSIPANTNTSYVVNWPTAFVDNAYTVSLSISQPTNVCSIISYNYLTSGTGINVYINNPSNAAISVTINVIGIHD